MAASISFGVLNNPSTIIPTGSSVSGSGLGFYGSGGFGTSVPLSQYQGTTYVTSSDGQTLGPAAQNTRYISASSCMITAYPTSGVLLSKINSGSATLIINFSNDTPVKVQNCQLRIYDRTSISSPASGVLTKVAEVANFLNQTYDTWLAANGNNAAAASSAVVGSGDALWWGAGWPKTYMYSTVSSDTANLQRPYYQNSVGVKFYNFTDTQVGLGSGNPDNALAGTMTGTETVGGSGLIVPLLDNPGSGGRGLISGMLYPKWVQYVASAYQNQIGGPVSASGYAGKASGDAGIMSGTWGGTGTDLTHTWRVALSASPTSIGAKQSYALYVSLEYL
jgi:hypothetical protein